MQSFNARIEQLGDQCTYKDDDAHLITCLSSLMSSDELFDVAQVDAPQFYMNLHNVLYNQNGNPKLTTACLSVLEVAARNADTREFLVAKMRMVPLLGEIVVTQINCSPVLKRQLFGLLYTLTDNITIAEDEPYLDWIIAHLSNLVCDDTGDMQMRMCALLVLNNLCSRNSSAMQCLIHEFPSMHEFFVILSQFGLAGMRMFLLLASIGITGAQNDNEIFLKYALAEIPKSVHDFNVDKLRCMTAILKDGYKNDVVDTMIKECDFVIAVRELLVELDNVSATVPEPFIGSVFEMISAIFGYNNSLATMYEPLLVFSLKYINDESMAGRAMDILRLIITDESRDIYTLNELILPKLAQLLERLELAVTVKGSTYNAIATFQLLVAFHTRYPVTTTLVSPTTFDYLLVPIVENAATFNPYAIDKKQLAIYVHCMHVLVTVAEAAKHQDDDFKMWQPMMTQLFASPHMQHLIARAILSENDLCGIVFQLARCALFPSSQISKILNSIRRKEVDPQRGTSMTQQQLCGASNRCCQLNKNTRKRLDDLLTHMLTTKDHNTTNAKVNNASNVIDLLNSKCRDHRIRDKRMQEQLKVANHQIAKLMYEQELVVRENTRFHGQIYLNQLSFDKLQKININRLEDAQHAIKATTALHDKYLCNENELRTLKKEYPERLANLEAQTNALKEQIEANEIKLRKNKTMLKLIPTLEAKCSGLTDKLGEAVEDGVRLRDENATLRATIQQLETLVAEKVALIEQINSDLEDQKLIDHQMMTLMEKKKARKK